ncbi:SirA family protein [Candidatus Terasakiella magnetica]|uniref:SirA family protein n=1 Tax=Candidatus Terasakiella magnetica TaxID=1867952 RepID=A0A1C3RF19_9PROT|nr:sulfurtransferase TusA family protein [Candidatus Terasakiella magnetica]SCA55877.1 SirA family protein [Candidatus Terasakiella magnetica]
MNTAQNKEKELHADRFIDITSDTCPMTFVKTKLQIEKMQSGQVIEVLLNEGEPLKNVPLSAEELGHKVLSTTKQEDGKTYKLLIQKV